MTTISLINHPLISSVTVTKEEAAIQKNCVLCHQFTVNLTFTVLLLLVHQNYTRKDNGLNIKGIRKYDSTLSCFILSDRLRYWHAAESRINGDMMEIQPPAPAPGISWLCQGASQPLHLEVRIASHLQSIDMVIQNFCSSSLCSHHFLYSTF